MILDPTRPNPTRSDPWIRVQLWHSHCQYSLRLHMEARLSWRRWFVRALVVLQQCTLMLNPRSNQFDSSLSKLDDVINAVTMKRNRRLYRLNCAIIRCVLNNFMELSWTTFTSNNESDEPRNTAHVVASSTSVEARFLGDYTQSTEWRLVNITALNKHQAAQYNKPQSASVTYHCSCLS